MTELIIFTSLVPVPMHIGQSDHMCCVNPVPLQFEHPLFLHVRQNDGTVGIRPTPLHELHFEHIGMQTLSIFIFF